jgi:putative protease
MAFVEEQVQNSSTVVVNNLQELAICQQTAESFEVGPSIGIWNQETLRFFNELNRDGLDRGEQGQAGQACTNQAWLSPELSIHQINALAMDSPLKLGLTIFGYQELMVTEHCILMAQGPCDKDCASCSRRKTPRLLKDDKGYEFPLRTDQFGRSHLYNAYALDLVPSLPELVTAGINTFLVDATLLNNKELSFEVQRAARGLELAVHKNGSLPKREGYTTGHLFRGVF